MLQKFAGFFSRLFNRKGFQRGLRIFCGVFVVYSLYNLIIFLITAMDIGVSFGEALRFYLKAPFFYGGWVPPSAGVALGIAIGLTWYFNRKRKSREKAEPDEKAEKNSDAVREEEIIETTRYRYH